MTDEIKKRIEHVKTGKVPEGYKRVKGKTIPATWSCKKLGDVLQKVGKRVVVEKDVYYTQVGIRSHGKGLFYKEPVSGTDLGNKTVFWIEKDCFVVNIVFAWEQAIGKTTEKEVGMIGSHRFPMYRAIPNEVSIDYLLWFFKTKRGNDVLEAASPGGAGRNKTLGQKEFANSKVYLPPFSEQEKIAEILAQCEKVIKLKKQLIAEECKQKEWLMEKLLYPDSGLRLENFYGEWSNVTISSLCNEIIDGDWIESKDQSDFGFRLIQTGNVGIGKFLDKYERAKYISEDTFKRLNCTEVLKGDLLISRLPDPIGRACIIGELEQRSITAVDCSILRFRNQSTAKYVLQYMCSSAYFKSISALSGGSTRTRVSRKEIENLKINIPKSLEEQNAITSILSTADRKIELLEQELEQWQQKKRALMQLLLTGIVRV